VCRRKTLSPAMLAMKGLSYHHPRAATVDHFPVPLSRGGDHDWDNVRCACRKCNCEKGAQWDKQTRMRLAFHD
jgi:5-methylcytosine-specific restriction endonuclease McrA